MSLFGIRFYVHHYVHFDARLLAGIESSLANLRKGQIKIMATLDELVAESAANKAAIADLKPAVEAIPGAIDALEAAVTAAIKDAPISAENQAKIDEAMDNLRGTSAEIADATAKLNAAAADAADGKDEAATAGASTGTTP